MVLALTHLGAFPDGGTGDEVPVIGEWGIVLGALAPSPTEQGVAPCLNEDVYGGLDLVGNPTVSSACILGVQDGALDLISQLGPDELDGLTTLTVSDDGTTMTITGDVTADRDGTIDQVSTISALVSVDTSTFPPSPIVEPFEFTATVVDPVPISEGQVVQVEVVLSFGTLP